MSDTGTATGAGTQDGGGNGGTGQEPDNANGQEGQEPEGQEQNGTDNGGTDNGSDDSQVDLSALPDNVRTFVEKLQKGAKEARDEAARHRTNAKEVQDRLTALERANETDSERAAREQQEREQATQDEKDRLARLEAENKALRIGNQVDAAARTAKAINPALVVTMLQDKVELDEQGKATNLDALLQGLRQSDPYMFRRTTTKDAGAGNESGDDGANTGGMNGFIRNALAARRGGGTTTNTD